MGTISFRRYDNVKKGSAVVNFHVCKSENDDSVQSRNSKIIALQTPAELKKTPPELSAQSLHLKYKTQKNPVSFS